MRAVLDEDAKDAAFQTTLHPVPSASVRQPAAPAGVPGKPAPASGNIIAGDPAADRLQAATSRARAHHRRL
jgi:hypothetical protein